MTTTAKLLKETTKKQKIEFIYKKYQHTENKIPRKEIYGYSISKLNDICRTYADEFKEFVENPPLSKFFADALTTDNEIIFYDGEYTSIDELETNINNDKNIKRLLKIAPMRGHHRCRYCNHIVNGSIKDVLCPNCQNLFNCQLYSDL